MITQAHNNLVETAQGTPITPAAHLTDGEMIQAFGHNVLIAKNGRPVNLAKAIILALTSYILRNADFGKRIGDKLGQGKTNGKVKAIASYLMDSTEDALNALVQSWDLAYLKRTGGKVSDDHTKRKQRLFDLILAKTPAELGKALRILSAFGGQLSVKADEGVMLITMSDLLGRFLTGSGLTNVQIAKRCDVVD